MQIGQKIIHLESVDSTNKSIANLLKQGDITHGTVILADDQFDGKGQRGAQWLVKPGENLTFSFLLENVSLSLSQQFYLTQVVSLSLIRLLKKLEISARIKWPNDIFVNGVKIAGILIENQVQNGVIKNSIIGIGLNVNQQKFDSFKATSIALELGIQHNLQEVLFSFIHSFNSTWIPHSEEAKRTIQHDYLAHLLNYKKKSSYSDKHGEFEGEITGVNEAGQLEVIKGTTKIAYDLKEIEFKL